MDTVIETHGLTKYYRRHPALLDVDLAVPSGRVIGLVGPNGAGKSTLLELACGLLRPTAGTITVLGGTPAGSPAQLARVGFVAQDTPVYTGLTVDDHLRLGAHLNPAWDQELAARRIRQIGLDPARRAGRLSGGQQAQLALTVAAAKRAELLIFDEPVGGLDPLARRQFLQSLLDFVAELAVTVVLSSHLISDLEQVCDHLIVLVASEVRVAGEVDDLLDTHHRLVGPRAELDELTAGAEVIQAEHQVDHSTLIVRFPAGLPAASPPTSERLSLEELVLAYLTGSMAGEGVR
jgi:ABC-2 type transport system ATP-binding protein